MADVKSYKKKLTNSGGGVCTLSFIAFLLAAAGACVDFAATEIYNHYYYNKKNSIFAGNWYEYIRNYDKALILAAFSFVVMCCVFSSKKKKKIGAGFAALVTVTSIAVSIAPVSMIVEKLSNGEIINALKYDNDYARFYASADLIGCALPAFSGFLLLLAGIILIGRVASEDFSVEIPVVKKIAVLPESAHISQTEQKNSDNLIPQDYINSELSKSFEKPEDNAAPASAVIGEEHSEYGGSSEFSSEEIKLETKECKECGFSVDSNAKFCRNCGKPI